MVTRYKKTNGEGVQVEDTRIAVVMVGLPARGKSLIAQKGIVQYPCSISPKLKLTTDTCISCPIPSLALNTCKDVQCRLLPSRRHATTHCRFLRYKEQRWRAFTACCSGSCCGRHDQMV